MALPGQPLTNIFQFRQTIRDISRAYLFMIRMPFVGTDDRLTSFARSTTLPAYKLHPVEVKFQSQTLRLAGPADFDGNWTVKFLCDEAHTIRHKFLAWMSVAYDPSIQVHGAPSQYLDDRVQVHQLDRRGNSIATYNFVGLFPSEVGQIDVAHDNLEPEAFDVNFTYSYWTLNAQNSVGGTFLGINQNGVSVGLPGVQTSVGGNAASINTTIGNFGLNVGI